MTTTVARFAVGAALTIAVGAGGPARALDATPAPRHVRQLAIALERTTAPPVAPSWGIAPRRGARVVFSLPLSRAWRVRTGLGLDVQDAPVAAERERAIQATTGLEFRF